MPRKYDYFLRKRTAEEKRAAMLKKAVVPKEVVDGIRSCAAAGMARKDLIVKFGLSGSVISNIVNNHTYVY